MIPHLDCAGSAPATGFSEPRDRARFIDTRPPHRIVLETIYDVPFLKNRNWVLKKLIGNWEIAPVYTYQTGQLATPQSGVNANLNGDSAPDGVFINPGGAALDVA